ncbi:serine hydrolase domain-containing protein [Microbacterium sp. F51-2R]|uniref:serine hydrolase domain-containing protein n=1 Tax=Microbacterium sp. F51-2R TaxID=3445777 RepID=UPI003F9ED283
MSEALEVRGTTAAGFDDVADILGRSAAGAALSQSGAALSVRHRGKPVVDLVVGDYDADRRQVLFSVTKIVTALTTFAARDRGDVDLDEPLAARWPALDREATRAITLRQVLSHRSGINGVDGRFPVATFWEGADVAAAAAQDPRWTPGSRHGYHMVTFGSLVRGYLEHVTGASFAEMFNQLVEPAVGSRVHIGADKQGIDDVQPILFAPPRAIRTPVDRAPDHGRDALIESLLADVTVFNSPEFVQATIPGMNAIGTAGGLADLLDAAARGALVQPASVDEMVKVASQGQDATLGVPSAFGTGVQRPFPRFPMTSPGSWGHEGAGGCAAFYDAERQLAVGFTTNAFPPYTGHSPVLAALLPSLVRAADAAA